MNINKKMISAYDKSLKAKTDMPITLFSFLFSEIVQYVLSKSDEEKDFDIEEKLGSFGFSIVIEYLTSG